MYGRPYHDACAPSIDPGVLARLRRLDKDLVVTWSPWVVDGLSGQPIIDNYTGRPVLDPAYAIWLCVDGDYRLVKTSKAFGHQEVEKLERDVGRHLNPADVMRQHTAKHQIKLRKAREDFRDRKQQVVDANAKRIGDLVFEGKTSERQARIFSAPNVGYRGTPGLIHRDSREDGWELPQEQEGLR